MKSKYLVFALTLVLAACATQSADENHSLVSPDMVELKLGVIFGGDYRYTADGTHAIKEVLAWRELMNSSSRHVPKKTEITPDKKAWAEFWDTVSQLKHEAWRQKYSTNDLTVKTENGGFSMVRVLDGMSWNLKIVRQKQLLTSEGGQRLSHGRRPEADHA
jgi:hypothetical protein